MSREPSHPLSGTGQSPRHFKPKEPVLGTPGLSGFGGLSVSLPLSLKLADEEVDQEVADLEGRGYERHTRHRKKG